MAIDHEFGAQHTELKLSIVESYLKAFTTALKPKFKELWYIDAFAGTGSRTVRVEARAGDLIDAAVPERIEQRRGSAQIAIDVSPRFDRLVFMDTKPSHCAALRDLARRHPDREIVVVETDANRAIQSAIAWDGWTQTRAVMFLDPYGMDVEWATLEATAATMRTTILSPCPVVFFAGIKRSAGKRVSCRFCRGFSGSLAPPLGRANEINGLYQIPLIRTRAPNGAVRWT
jgi:three-Cys-motif partner protein